MRTSSERLSEWIEFSNLLIPQGDLRPPSELSGDTPLVQALAEQFRNRFLPRRPLTETERQEEREELNVAFARRYPGPRNKAALKAAVEKALQRLDRRGWGEFVSFFIWSGSDGRAQTPDVLALYRLFYSVRRSLSALAEAGRQVAETGEAAHLSLAMPPTRELTVGADGKAYAIFPGFVLHIYDSFYEQFVPLVLSEDIDIVRIRVCEVCRRFFYGKRRDQLGCSRAHRDVIRARRFRENHPRYEKNRRRNRAAKAARKSRSWLKKSERPIGGKAR